MTSPHLVLAACVALLAGCAAAQPHATMTAFGDEAQLQRALARWREASQRAQGERLRSVAPTAQALQALAAAPMLSAKAEAAAPAAADAITNVQTAGVDEGGIVKRSGDFLVVLRRGRLFTLRIGGDRLEPVATADAYAPGSDPQGAWYDELLVAGSTVVVVGYSYARGGTEIGLYALSGTGGLSHRATYHLRSHDYYSARNYASRLVGRQLVFYSPMLMPPGRPFPASMMPGVRRWRPQALPGDFERLLPATRIYRSDEDFDPLEPLALHTVTRCTLGEADLRCEATAVLGPAGRVSYVGTEAAYVWTAGTRGRGAAVFRLPLDGAAPSALQAAGMPIDQFSFLDDGTHLNVLLAEQGGGESMGANAGNGGALALLRVPLSAFGDGRDAAGPEHYRRLPGPRAWNLQNRFVGDWLLWGGAQPTAWALRFAERAEPIALRPGHAVERIEALGRHALLVGNAGSDLHLSSVRLDADGAALADRHVQRGARQGETRSHGFFYRADDDGGGLLGLPVVQGDGRGAGIGFLRETALTLAPLGQLNSRETERDDRCQVSCVDWYGNARPIFTEGRVFALMGYELVEGRVARAPGGERLLERRRVSFAPGLPRRGVYNPFD